VNYRSHEPRQGELDLNVVPSGRQQRTVRREGGGDTRLRVVKEIEIIADARRVWSEVHGSPASEVAIVARRLREDAEHVALQRS
jgi:hypothetical protein